MFSSTELVSIVTPAFNAARFIRETISSAQSQTHTNWEMLVVDDGSTDDTFQIVSGAASADRRMILLRSPEARGVAAARNLALEHAQGRYIAFLDSDDLWDAAKLERQIAFMRDRRAAFSCSGYRLISEDGMLLGRVEAPEIITYRDMLCGHRVGCLTVIIDRDFVSTPRFPEFSKASDLAGWLSILHGGHVAHGFKHELAAYRVVGTSISRRKAKYVGGVWDIYRTQPLPPADLAWCYAQYAIRGLVKHMLSGAFRVRPE
jgi:teichuronic acid biosynthesis glycosyltransferase TuaG